MPKITYKQFVGLIALDTNSSTRTVEKNISNIINRLYKEILRGNTVVINNFGTFSPRVAGGSDETQKYRVTDSSVLIDFSFSDGGIQSLNGEISTSGGKNRVKNGNPTLYERVLLNLEEYEDDEKKLKRKRKLQDSEKIFNKIVKQRLEKVRNKYGIQIDDEMDDIEIDEDENEKENDDEGML